jgi:hypothetical protein
MGKFTKAERLLIFHHGLCCTELLSSFVGYNTSVFKFVDTTNRCTLTNVTCVREFCCFSIYIFIPSVPTPQRKKLVFN